MPKVIFENGKPILRDDWDEADVHGQAGEMDIELTDDEALEVMHLIARTFDAHIGVNWDVIGQAIEAVKERVNENE